MLFMNMMSILILIHVCISDTPYLLRSYPGDSTVVQSSFTSGPCIEPIRELLFLQGTDDASLDHTDCDYNSNNFILTCKLGLQHNSSALDLEKYPLKQIKILILFVQEFPENNVKSRVLDLCFIKLFGSSLRELAICGYKPQVIASSKNTYLHILDLPALAIVASKIQTLLISSMF